MMTRGLVRASEGPETCEWGYRIDVGADHLAPQQDARLPVSSNEGDLANPNTRPYHPLSISKGLPEPTQKEINGVK